ncbi:MAG: hypothetical protein WC155_03655 [Candidatus Cloacimonadales bacterium]
MILKLSIRGDCDDGKSAQSCALEDFLGSDGVNNLLSFYSIGPLKRALYPDEGSSKSRIFDNDEFIDLIRRVQIPYYEEARQYFNKGEVVEYYSDNHEYAPYLPHILKKIIEDNQTT